MNAAKRSPIIVCRFYRSIFHQVTRTYAHAAATIEPAKPYMTSPRTSFKSNALRRFSEQKANELGRFLAGKAPKLDFEEPAPSLDRQDDKELRAKILGLTTSEAGRLGIGKRTLHYLRRNERKDRFKIFASTATKLRAIAE